MNRPDFQTLQALPGRPDVRLVNGCWMTKDEYDICEWHVTGEYPSDTGKTVSYWSATLDGLRKWGELLAQRRSERKVAYQTRMAEDDEFNEYINALDDAKPQR